jgi:large subunit ribosomal protein L3
MMRLFSEDGVSTAVTVLDVSRNRVVQIKTDEVDGYTAVQMIFEGRRGDLLNKPSIGHLSKAGVACGGALREFRLTPSDRVGELKAGDTIGVEIFSVGQVVDVSGVSIGKGYAGAIKRHNFSSNRASHGNSVSHNSPGSIGMAQDPGRVFPGKRMSGHLGDVKRVVQNLKVIRIDVDRQLLMVNGAVPGSKGGDVIVLPAVKIKTRAGE